MSCATCTNSGDGQPSGCRNNGTCGNEGCNKLSIFNWLSNMELPGNLEAFDCFEVRFKNGRKAFYRNEAKLHINQGDAVVVEGSLEDYDLGIISMCGELVRLQMKKKNIFPKSEDIKLLKRKATEEDIKLWQKGKAKEGDAMVKARKIAMDLDLKMKISDVEYQGDLSKAIFYYTAEERVDFRDLIKKLAESFKLRIEMKQIGMRQEASRIGGIGSCGRELCCSTWLNDFRSVATSAARYQQLSLNPSKLAGQCGKLKCCLNFELDVYLDELKKFPDSKIKLKSKKGTAFFQKMDIFSNQLWYSYKDEPFEFIPLSLNRVKEIIQANKEGEIVNDLKEYQEMLVEKAPDYANVVGQDDLTRFDNRNKKRNHKRKKRKPQQRAKK